MLGRGELRCIGATTLNEFRKYIEKDPALERRFQQVMVNEPSVPDTISILRGLRERCRACNTQNNGRCEMIARQDVCMGTNSDAGIKECCDLCSIPWRDCTSSLDSLSPVHRVFQHTAMH